jgi:hypothetical protein
MHDLLRKIHMYLGLLSWSTLIVFGIAGLAATFRAPSESKPPSQARTEEFAVAPNSTDQQVADAVWEKLNVPYAGKPREWAYHRDAANQMVVDLWTPNGVTEATVLEKEARLRVETRRNNLAQFFNDLHTMSARTEMPGWPIRLWSYYNEFAIFTLLAMALTGLALWLSSRPRYRLAQAALIFACVLFATLYFMTR